MKKLNTKKSKSTTTDTKKKTTTAGRKSKYQSHVVPNLHRIPKWRRDGLTEEQIAKRLGIAMSTFSEYKLKYPELMEALKKGREELIEELEDSLYKKALGYDYTETKEEYEGNVLVKKVKMVKHVSPDTAALVFALKNLAPNKWKNEERVEIVSPEAVKETTVLEATLNAISTNQVTFEEDKEYMNE